MVRYVLTRVRAALVILALSQAAQAQIAPKCVAPALLTGPRSCGTANYIVVFNGQVNAAATTHTLEQKYGFVAIHIYTLVPSFYASLSAQQVAELRCEPVTWFVEREMPLCFPGSCPPPPPDEGLCTEPVPTLDEFAILLLGAGLAICGVCLLRR